MEELTTKIKNSITAAQDLPEVKRTEDGKIDLASITVGKTEKGYLIVNDNILEAYSKELPNNTVNKSNTKRVFNGGLLKILNSEDAKIQRAGALASNAKQAQRRSLNELAKVLLSQEATAAEVEELEEAGASQGMTRGEVLMIAMQKQALKGNVKAAEFIRDTAGEKPTEKLDASVTALTPEDKELMLRVASRLPE